MIEQVAAAIQQGDYSQAYRFLKPLIRQQPHNPWVQLYLGQLHELGHRPDRARAVYRQLLRGTTNRQVLGQARQGLERLTPSAASAPQVPPSPPALTTTAEAILVLKPVDSRDRDRAISAYSQLASVDPYTARTQLPVRGWRLHSIGQCAALRHYVKQLEQINIPAQILSLQDILGIHVFRVRAFRQLQLPNVLCENAAGQLGNLAFQWPEVAQGVEGRLPIFEQVVDRDARKRVTRKEKTQDYAYVFDLHLPKRRTILRLCDQSYRFSPSSNSAGVVGKSLSQPLTRPSAGLTRLHQWRTLMQTLMAQIDGPTWSDFIPFGESALDTMDTLPTFEPYIDILRKRKTGWDEAFHTYSSLIFYQTTTPRP